MTKKKEGAVGGRMMVSDIVLDSELPAQVKDSVAAYTGCIGGALKRADYLDASAKVSAQKLMIASSEAFARKQDAIFSMASPATQNGFVGNISKGDIHG